MAPARLVPSSCASAPRNTREAGISSNDIILYWTLLCLSNARWYRLQIDIDLHLLYILQGSHMRNSLVKMILYGGNYYKSFEIWFIIYIVYKSNAIFWIWWKRALFQYCQRKFCIFLKNNTLITMKSKSFNFKHQ